MHERFYYQRDLEKPTERASGFGSPTTKWYQSLTTCSSHFLRLDLPSGSCVTRILILFIAGIIAFTARYILLIFDDYSFLRLMLMDRSLALLALHSAGYLA